MTGVELVYIALSVGLSILAGKLLAKKIKSPVDDSGPTTLTTRGSYTNYLIGHRAVGPVFCWAGDREVRKEKGQGGKGGGSAPEQNVYYEAGWHVLASNGPITSLNEIIQGGKAIFVGPITRDSHPSGSTVDLGKEGAFRIFWGEENQPINTFLGAASRVGISSRWPFFCYIEWNKKRLSGSPQWPVLEYNLLKKTGSTLLVSTTGYIPPTETLNGPTKTFFAVANGAQGTGRFTILGDVSSIFPPSLPVQLSGNSMASGRYVVLKSVVYQFEVTPPTPPTIPGVYQTRTDVYLYGGLTGANTAGSLQAYSIEKDDGINPAHAIAEMLFESWPQGIGLDSAGNEPWDIPSLEALGVEANTDRVVTSWIATQGDTIEQVLGAGLQDLGTMVPLDTNTGRLLFQRVRFPTGTLPNIPEEAQTFLPEIETNHGEKPVDRLVFSFADRSHGYKDATIAIDDDGSASYSEYQRARSVPITIVTHFDSAAKIAERRSQEELGGSGGITLKVNRAARELIPGDAIVVEGYPDILRVMNVSIDTESSEVEVKCLPDYYGAKISDFQNSQGGGQVNFAAPQPDLAFEFVELNEFLLGSSPFTVVVPRIRANNLVVGADIWLSRDNTTYNLNTQELGIVTGGTLIDPLTDIDDNVDAQGPTFTALGPDIATALDLSADTTNWRLGRQLAIISSTAGIEICYLQKITALGGSTYRLDGLIRSRYDSKKLNHPASATVYICEPTDLTPVQDILLVPDLLLYVKTQPQTGGGSVSLAAVSPVGHQLYGKGTKPMELVGIDVTAPYKGSPSYTNGQDVSLRWGYRHANELTSSAGQQGAGTAVGTQTPLGTFTVEFLTLANVLKRTVSVSGANTYTYTNANLVTDFGSEVSFKVRVKQTDAGYTTPSIELTITKV